MAKSKKNKLIVFFVHFIMQEISMDSLFEH